MTDLFALAVEMDEVETWVAAAFAPVRPSAPVGAWTYPCGVCSHNVSIRPTGDPGRPTMMVCDNCGLRTVECICIRVPWKGNDHA